MNFGKCSLYIGGRRIEADVKVVEASSNEVGSSLSPSPLTGYTARVDLVTTPAQREAWDEAIPRISWRSRRAKKHQSRTDREFRKVLVRIAGSTAIPTHLKRRMVETKSLRAMGIRIPRSLR